LSFVPSPVCLFLIFLRTRLTISEKGILAWVTLKDSAWHSNQLDQDNTHFPKEKYL
jgi:hypothetical protein